MGRPYTACGIKAWGGTEMIKDSRKIYRALLICLWIVLFCVIFANRDKISVEKIVSFSPENPLPAVLIILALFVAKGFSGLINSDIIFVSCGIMFSLPFALSIGLLGCFIMCSIPYFPGYKGGAELMDKLIEKHKKLERVYYFPNENQFMFAFLLRVFGLIPCEAVSMYLGSCRLSYKNYISGTMLGIFPSVLAFTLMGAFASDPASPQFIGALALKISLPVLALIGGGLMKKRTKKAAAYKHDASGTQEDEF